MDSEVILRIPVAEDGMAVHQLVQACPPLDTNSAYCNLLQCSHFANTSVAAEQQGELVGFVSGYLIPDRPNRLFIWQVAVHEKARGQGLAGRMIEHILQRGFCQSVDYIETTITEDNRASWALFEGIASRLGTDIKRSVMFDHQRHFKGEHDTEMLAEIGPF